MSSFLRNYPETVELDMNSDRHTVRLKKLDEDDECITIDTKIVRHFDGELLDRTLYELRKRQAKQTRRSKDDDKDIPGAQLEWLTRKVEKQLYTFLRSQFKSPKFVLPFTEEWLNEVQIYYLQYLENKIKDNCQIEIKKDNNGQIRVHLMSDNKDDTIPLKQISSRILHILKMRKNPVGGVEIGMILSDKDLRSMTDGADLRQMIKKYPQYFRDIHLFEEFDDDQQCSCFIDIERDVLNRSEDELLIQDRKLLSDDVGRYSVTKPKLAAVMTKTLYRICNDRNPDCSVAIDNKSVCVDLTAGIGGNTMSFSRVFSKVYAYEIDENRFGCLSENIKRLDTVYKNRIKIECRDSLEAFQELVVNNVLSESGSVVVFIDPPFGGIRRKKELISGQHLFLGDVPLTRVLINVASSIMVTFGLKLPLNFDVHTFLEELSKERRKFEAVCIKKMEQQLFVVLQVAPK
ncbi:hypothetical protein CTEN210_07669 [Chaetoceros tenuissimus]|uniref:Trimethylguanosine synthase n=1 Tax=Chaetoceros tenuissimus TaxID=426638 RepID=A0AAD3CSN6_9STRA|nr:hypothetical protein CTEN210_07669 [Chaetoceros tenuissimus]